MFNLPKPYEINKRKLALEKSKLSASFERRTELNPGKFNRYNTLMSPLSKPSTFLKATETQQKCEEQSSPDSKLKFESLQVPEDKNKNVDLLKSPIMARRAMLQEALALPIQRCPTILDKHKKSKISPKNSVKNVSSFLDHMESPRLAEKLKLKPLDAKTRKFTTIAEVKEPNDLLSQRSIGKSKISGKALPKVRSVIMESLKKSILGFSLKNYMSPRLMSTNILSKKNLTSLTLGESNTSPLMARNLKVMRNTTTCLPEKKVQNSNKMIQGVSISQRIKNIYGKTAKPKLLLNF